MKQLSIETLFTLPRSAVRNKEFNLPDEIDWR